MKCRRRELLLIGSASEMMAPLHRRLFRATRTSKVDTHGKKYLVGAFVSLALRESQSGEMNIIFSLVRFFFPFHR